MFYKINTFPYLKDLASPVQKHIKPKFGSPACATREKKIASTYSSFIPWLLVW
jgi:hypothetical protein